MSAADATGAPLDLAAVLARGTGAADPNELGSALQLGPVTADSVLCQRLVRLAAERAVHALERDHASTAVGRVDTDPSLVIASRTSYFMRMPVRTSAGELAVSKLEDVRTLLAVMRTGSLLQRRAAVLRLSELLEASDKLPAEWRRQAVEALASSRRLDIAYEVAHARQDLPGSDGRAARAEERALTELAGKLEARIITYWEDQETEDPLAQLSSEERAHLLSRARDLSDVVLRHISATIEAADTATERVKARLLLAAIEHCGDRRLLPALRTVIDGRDPDFMRFAVRALGRIEDPRAQGVLKDAFERAARTEDRLLLAAALGSLGDARGLPFARAALASSDPGSLVPALEALAELGSTDDVQRVLEALQHADEPVARAAVAALARIADSRALSPLAELRRRTRSSAVRAEIEEAEAAIDARMELAGEERPSHPSASVTWDTTKMAALARTRDPAGVRFWATKNYWLGYVWLALGGRQRAIGCFEAAAALRPGWIEPVLAMALLHARRNETAQALAKFRRAVEIDRGHVELHGSAITAMAQAFLRRAESVEREGRLDIARGLVEEMLSFDLRRAAPGVRLALRERREAHRMQSR